MLSLLLHGLCVHTSHAVDLIPSFTEETVSHPDSAWNYGKTDTFSDPRVAAMVWIGMFRRCFPEPYPTHISSAGMIVAAIETENTCNHVDVIGSDHDSLIATEARIQDVYH